MNPWRLVTLAALVVILILLICILLRLNAAKIQIRFRKRRMTLFKKCFPFITGETRILDLGGSPWNWRISGSWPRVTILNLFHLDEDSPGFVNIHGDARSAPFADQEFDIAFSNSVLEHVGTWEQQKQFASECRRCAKSYFVQTPNRWFPIDMHTWLPFVHWLPDRWFKQLLWLSPRLWRAADKATATLSCQEMRMIGSRELRELFPEATILKESFLGIPKSLIALRSPSMTCEISTDTATRQHQASTPSR